MVRPRYWVDTSEVLDRIKREEGNAKAIPKWLMGWRDITNATNERTVIVSVLPIAAVNHKLPLLNFPEKSSTVLLCCFYGNLNAIVLDYVARQKIGGTDLTYHYLKQFPVLLPNAYSQNDIEFIVPRVLELTYTAIDLIPFAEDLWDSGDQKMRRLFMKQRHGEKAATFEEFSAFDSAHLPEGVKLQDVLPPFLFDSEQRSSLRAALDARYARLYGLSRDDLRYILDPADPMGEDYPSETFRVLKEKEIAEYGEYRTQQLILEAWDGEGV